MIQFLSSPTCSVRSVTLALLFSSSALSAQTLSTVQGTVTNEAGRPLEQAQVTLDPAGSNRQVRTDGEGRYSFVGVSPGSHSIRVTWVGFSPESRDVSVIAGVNTVDFVLRRLTRLDTMVVTAKRTGIYGSVISLDSFLPVPGARIEILGARKSDSTNSSGVFNFPDIKGGSYIVRVKHPFFDSRNFSVVVPVNGGTELDVVVERGRVSRDAHMEGLYRDMDSRLTFRTLNAAFVTSEEFKGREKLPLDHALAFANEFAKKGLRYFRDACVFVDGIARPGATLADFSPEDIESVELYATPVRRPRLGDLPASLVDRWPERVPCGQPLSPNEQRISGSTIKVRFAAVWLKRR